jgi:hypothetical protein
MPYLIRRMGLVVNTIKFMGYAKKKGLTLKNYLKKFIKTLSRPFHFGANSIFGFSWIG